MKAVRKVFKEWFGVGGALLVILTASVLLRVSNLNELPIFADEAIYVRWAQVMKAEPTLRFLPLSDGKQPLFMWGVIPFLKFIADPLVAGRLMSVAASAGALVGLFVAGYLLFDSKKVGLAASILYALSPYAVFFDRMALVDSLLAMCGIWYFVFLILTVKLKRLDTAMIAGFFLGFAFLTKSPALFMLLMSPSVLLIKLKEFKKQPMNFLLHYGFFLIVGWVIGFGMYNILRLGPNFHLLTSRTKDYVYPISHLWSSPFDPLKPYLDRGLRYFWNLGNQGIALLALSSFFLLFKKHKSQLLLISFWLFVPLFIVSEFSKTMTARYIYYSFPFFILLAGSGLVMLHQKLEKMKNKLAQTGFVVFLAASFILAFHADYVIVTNIEAAYLPRSERSGYLEEWTAGTGIKEASEVIRQYHRAHPEEKIVVGTEGFFGTLPDAMQVYLNDLPEITVIGTGLDFTKIPSSLVESRAAGNKTYLVVNSSRFKFDTSEFEKLGLMVVAQYEKAERPLGREYVQHGPHDILYLFELQ